MRINGLLIDFFQVTWRKRGLLLHFAHVTPEGRLVVSKHINSILQMPLNIKLSFREEDGCVVVLWSRYDVG